MLAQLLATTISGKQLIVWVSFLDREYGFVAAAALGLVLASLFYGLLWALSRMLEAYRAESRGVQLARVWRRRRPD